MTTDPGDDEDYETIELLYNPLVSRLQQALEVVKQFIIDRGLIITGGMAIDYALRDKGDRIYGDNSASSLIPDWDFYSSNHLADSYDLADILFNSGYGAAGADVSAHKVDTIRAVHVSTMRVRVDREVVADITYVPKEVFDAMPHLTVGKLKVIHPHWQIMNVHRSLTYLFENPPREVVFSRMSKDIVRGAKLYGVYPLAQSVTSIEVIRVPWPKGMFDAPLIAKKSAREIDNVDVLDEIADAAKHIIAKTGGADAFIRDERHGTVLYGFAAYAATYAYYKRLLPDQLEGIQSADIGEEGFTSVNSDVEFVTTDHDLAQVFRNGDWTEYEPYLDNALPFYEKDGMRYFQLRNTMIGVSTFDLIPAKNISVYIPPANMLLLYFLLHYNRKNADAVYGKFYTSLLLMCKNVGKYVDDIIEKYKDVKLGTKGIPRELQKADEIILSSPFFAPKKLYGSRNVSESDELQLHEIAGKLSKSMHVAYTVDVPRVPDRVYNPTADQSGHAPFDYEGSRLFRIRGLPIAKGTNLSTLLE